MPKSDDEHTSRRKRDIIKEKLGLSKDSPTPEQAFAAYDALQDKYPKPVQLDTIEGTAALQERMGPQLSALETMVTTMLEETTTILRPRATVEHPEFHRIAKSTICVKEHLAKLVSFRAGADFRTNIYLSGGYRSLLLHLHDSCRDICGVMNTKEGSKFSLSHFHTKSLKRSDIVKLLAPRVYILDVLAEKMQLICSLWVKVNSPESKERLVEEMRSVQPRTITVEDSNDATVVFLPFRTMDQMYNEHGIEQGKVFADWHFGYMSKSYLCSFALSMKALHVCCNESKEWRSASSLLSSGAVLAKMPALLLDPEEVITKYTRLRNEGMPLHVLRGMWNLMESRTLAYFATTLNVGISKNHYLTPTFNPVPIVLGTCLKVTLPTGVPKAGVEGFPCQLMSWYHLDVDKNVIDSGQSGRSKVQDGIGLATHLKDKLKRSEEKDLQSVLIVHIHGGGFVAQSPASHLVYLKEWVRRTKLPVLSLDYSLSPEASFPTALNECYAVYKWIHHPDNARMLGLAGDVRVILAGDSAGGNLCLAVAVKAIEENLRGGSHPPRPIGMLLHYPVALLSLSASISRLLFENDPILHFQSMALVAASYLGQGDERVPFTNWHFSPALAPDEVLSNFPPTYLAAGDVDPLIDDSLYLFERLESVNVRTVLRFYRHLPHGYLNLNILPGAHSASKDAAAFLKYLAAIHRDPALGKTPFNVKEYRKKLDSIPGEEPAPDSQA